MSRPFSQLCREARACTLCEDELDAGVRPVFQADPAARILIAGQAPGLRVHRSGVPFKDASGERLRDWMAVSESTFYDPSRIAILPMGFCYPGKGASGDLPPRPECAPTWRADFLSAMPRIALKLVIGQYAQQWHLESGRRSVTDVVRDWQSVGEAVLPLPHPSPRNNIWLRKNPWFEESVVPALRERVARALSS